MSSSNLPLRERKKEQTRSDLFRAASQLFEERGFQATTVDQIVDLAGISRRTFFRYFPCKEAVLFPFHRPRLEHFHALLEAHAMYPPFEQVRNAFLGLAEDFMAQREALLLQRKIARSSPALTAYELKQDQEWEDVVARAIHSNASSESHLDGFRIRIAAGAIIGVIRAALRVWLDEEESIDLKELGNEVFDMLEQGFQLS